MNTVEITEDTLLGGRVRLLQPKEGYRAAIDPVLLAAATPAKPGEAVLELGSGSGAASLCLGTRVHGLSIVGLEQQADLVALANQSAALNDLDGRVTFVAGDLLRPPDEIKKGGFDHVIANPPYQRAEHGHPPPNPAKAVANVEGAARLADWIDASVDLVTGRGSVTIIHRADRLDEILSHMQGRLGGIKVCPLWPGADKPAKRVIVSGRKGDRAPLITGPGLILHRDGGYTDAARAILEGGALSL